MYKVLLFFLAASMIACGHSKESSGSENSNSSEKDTTKVAPPVDAQNQLAPGTARVKVEFREHLKENNSETWDVKISQVMGYGSSTPLIGSGSDMIIDVTNYYRSYDKAHEKPNYQKGESMICVLAHKSEPVGGYSKKSPRWQLVRILDTDQ